MSAIQLPDISAAVPASLRTGSTDPMHINLATTLAGMGHVTQADLRVGGGGIRRLSEKVLERWWNEAELPQWRGIPLSFRLEAGRGCEGLHMPDDQRDDPFLILTAQGGNGRPHHAILEYDYGRQRQRHPEAADHALATLYQALEMFSYSLTPQYFLFFAQRYWWRGEDDISKEERKRTGFLTRKMFHTRFDPCCLAPRRYRFPNGHPWPEVRALERAMRARPILLRNATTERPHPVWDLALIVRWRWSDDYGRLLDHWREDLEPHTVSSFTGRWRLRTPEEIERVRRALPNTVRLIAAAEALLSRLATRSQGGMWS